MKISLKHCYLFGDQAFDKNTNDIILRYIIIRNYLRDVLALSYKLDTLLYSVYRAS